ncbi:MAG: BrnT family toxin [Defluviitaleaceae bacterium]|nr:BrnT family toxin [Defluviitaleaceae bacterium]
MGRRNWGGKYYSVAENVTKQVNRRGREIFRPAFVEIFFDRSLKILYNDFGAVCMTKGKIMRYENFIWDDDKYYSNIKKHNVDFREATTVFTDSNALLEEDTRHFYGEERFTILGMSEETRVLMVCHCYKDNGIIRIISARKATKQETKKYTKYSQKGKWQ